LRSAGKKIHGSRFQDGALKLSDIAKYGAEEAGAYDDIGLEKTDTPDAHLSGRTFRDFIAGLTALQSSTCLTQENVRRAKEPP
jgi:hypothetical protein